MKLSAGTPLLVSLRFSAQQEMAVGRMAMDRGKAILEYDPGLLASGFSLNPIAAPPGPEPLGPKDRRVFEGLPGIVADSLPRRVGAVIASASRATRGHRLLVAHGTR